MKGLLKVLVHAAPTIAGALGVPGIAVGALERLSKAVLGKPDGTEDEIAAELAKANPEVFERLKLAEMEFAKFMADNNLQLEKLAGDDRASARLREASVKDWVPAALAMGTVAAYTAAMGAILLRSVPADSREVVIACLRILENLLIFVFAYYFGSSAGSQRKTALLGKAANGEN